MASLPGLGRIVRLVTIPETRRLIVAAARSRGLREIPHRALHDRAGLARDLRSPANARALVRSAAGHPATRELANAGLVFLPMRYLPLGWAATWATRRVLRRVARPPAEVDAGSAEAGHDADGRDADVRDSRPGYRSP